MGIVFQYKKTEKMMVIVKVNKGDIQGIPF